MSDARPPEKTFSLGNIHVSVFRNETVDSVYRNTSVSRSWQDDEGEWNYSTSFATKDLPALIYLLQQALDYAHERDDWERERRRPRRTTQDPTDDDS